MNSEAKIQQNCVMWFRNMYCTTMSTPRCQIFSVPNESKDVKEVMTKKATGMLAGASDLVVVLPGSVLFMECKVDEGRQSKAQIDFELSVTRLHHKYHVFRSLKQFQKIIWKYLPE